MSLYARRPMRQRLGGVPAFAVTVTNRLGEIVGARAEDEQRADG